MERIRELLAQPDTIFIVWGILVVIASLIALVMYRRSTLAKKEFYVGYVILFVSVVMVLAVVHAFK